MLDPDRVASDRCAEYTASGNAVAHRTAAPERIRRTVNRESCLTDGFRRDADLLGYPPEEILSELPSNGANQLRSYGRHRAADLNVGFAFHTGSRTLVDDSDGSRPSYDAGLAFPVECESKRLWWANIL